MQKFDKKIVFEYNCTDEILFILSFNYKKWKKLEAMLKNTETLYLHI